jgi:hypothetical protein
METKYASCISDNADIRVILSVLYTIIEVVRCYETEINSCRMQSNKDFEMKISKIKNELKNELSKRSKQTILKLLIDLNI